MRISPILELGCFRLTLALANVSKMSACPHWGKSYESYKTTYYCFAPLIMFKQNVSDPQSACFQVMYLCCQVHWGKPIYILIRWTDLGRGILKICCLRKKHLTSPTPFSSMILTASIWPPSVARWSGELLLNLFLAPVTRALTCKVTVNSSGHNSPTLSTANMAFSTSTEPFLAAR